MAKRPTIIETLRHQDATRKNIPTAELESVMREDEKSPVQVAYERRNKDLDPQLVWRGKDMADWSDLVVSAPPLYIQEKVHPKVIVDDLRRQAALRKKETAPEAPDLFGDFNGLPDIEAKTEFYAHDQHWSNRMISGDSLQVMASLAEREGLRGKVQCIYFDPPYGIKFNSNFQWSTTSRDVKDGDKTHVTREPEQVRAFRDTWRDGIHSYLTYLRDRLTVARDLLTDSGSLFVQIGDENVHYVRSILDEVFGNENFVSLITIQKTGGQPGLLLSNNSDYVLFYAKTKSSLKYRQLFHEKKQGEGAGSGARYSQIDTEGGGAYQLDNLTSAKPPGYFPVFCEGREFFPGQRYWTTGEVGMGRLTKAQRVMVGDRTLRFKRYLADFPAYQVTNLWSDVAGASGRIYVVQTSDKVIERCMLMTTDPGDLVLDPTCGSGTTAYVSENWGRRWITIDTSRVAVALARSRLMGARYPYFLLADSPEGQKKEAEVTRTPPKTAPTYGDVRHGFVYERVPHVTLKSIANNAEINVIWEKWQESLEPLREELNKLTSSKFEEWEIPREVEKGWDEKAKAAHAKWWEARIARQKEIDASIAAKADFEYLYDKPYTDGSRIRVAGPFTVESLSPHRVLAVGPNDELIDTLEAAEGRRKAEAVEAGRPDFAAMVLENLRNAGVQQPFKDAKINFTSLTGYPGKFLGAVGTYMEGDAEKRAGILIGPEFGTVSRPDLVAAAKEAGDTGFDVLIACAFNYDAHSTEFDKLGRVPVLKARMNPDLMMAKDLKSTGAGNLFVVFGEPDIKIETLDGGQLRVKVFGVDVFKPQTGEVHSEGTDGIALWLLDTDYNEESFFVRHAYFLGANDPYKALKTTLKAEIDAETWETLHSDVSRPFPKPASGRIAVKVINHLGDEVMKVLAV